MMKFEFFVRGICKRIHSSSSGFTVAVCSFPKYWIPLQAFARIVPSFQEKLACFPSFLVFSTFYSWKNFRVRKVLKGNIFTEQKDTYIFIYLYFHRKIWRKIHCLIVKHIWWNEINNWFHLSCFPLKKPQTISIHWFYLLHSHVDTSTKSR